MSKAQKWDYAAVDALIEAYNLDLSVNQYEAIALAVHRIGPGDFPRTALYRHLSAGDFDGAHDALLELARNASGAVSEDYGAAAELFVSPVHPPRQPDDPGVDPEPEPDAPKRETDALSMLLILGGVGGLLALLAAWIYA